MPKKKQSPNTTVGVLPLAPPRQESRRLDPVGDPPRTPTTRRDLWFLVGATVLAFLPFLKKAFHIDDPMFLWAARRIYDHPFDPYGFSVNWMGREQPAYEHFFHMPFNSYYLHFATRLVGWSEPALHLAYLIPTVTAILATYFIARKLCGTPVFATFLTLLTPAFLVSNSNLMSEGWFCAFWVLGIALWMHGVEVESHGWLAAATVAVIGCVMTRFNGVFLIPILTVYALMKRRPWWWNAYFLAPIALFVVYQYAYFELYRLIPILEAQKFTARATSGTPVHLRVLMGLVYVGGSISGLLFFTPWLWSRWKWIVGGAALTVGIGYLATLVPFPQSARGMTSIAFQFGLFGAAGVSLGALLVAELRQRRPDAGTVLLVLWIGAVFAFTGIMNWVVNVRSVLPMVPAVAIVIARRLGTDFVPRRLDAGNLWRITAPTAACAALSFAVAWGDYTFANAQRTLFQDVRARYRHPPNTTWYFNVGGMAFYMNDIGAKYFDTSYSLVVDKDVLICPLKAYNDTVLIRAENYTLAETIEIPVCSWVTTADKIIGAGYYSHLAFGALPYAFGRVQPEKYKVYVANKKILYMESKYKPSTTFSD